MRQYRSQLNAGQKKKSANFDQSLNKIIMSSCWLCER